MYAMLKTETSPQLHARDLAMKIGQFDDLVFVDIENVMSAH